MLHRFVLFVSLLLVPNLSAASEKVEVGWIAACETFDLNARLADVKPEDYIVWLWENRSEILLCDGVQIDLVIYEGDGGKELWRTTAETAIHRVAIPRSLAIRGGLICAEVHGRKITHAAKVGRKGDDTYISCSFRLPEAVRSGRAHGGFGIPLILQEEGS